MRVMKGEKVESREPTSSHEKSKKKNIFFVVRRFFFYSLEKVNNVTQKKIGNVSECPWVQVMMLGWLLLVSNSTGVV